MQLQDYLQAMPLVAILRGIKPEQALEIAQVVIDAGFRIMEVPLNSPQPYQSIQQLVQAHGDDVLIGAGTVLSCEQVDQVAAAGGRLIVMPHSDPAVIAHAKQKNLICIPGFVTPTEAFAAIAAGADALKCFPGNLISPQALQALTAVLPKHIPLLPVGGIDPASMEAYWQAGAAGFGLGSALYKAGRTATEVQAQAEAFVVAFRALPQAQSGSA